MHRSDDSGTTENFTDYLSQAADGAWTYDPDGVWPIQGGEAAEGTSGLVAAVKAGDGTIGYADESQAGDLGIAAIKVGEEYVAPSAEGAAKVVAVSPRVEGRGDERHGHRGRPHHHRVGCLPAILVSYLIACPTYDDANEAALVKGFLPTSCRRRASRPPPTRPAPRRSTLAGRRGRRDHRRDQVGHEQISGDP